MGAGPPEPVSTTRTPPTRPPTPRTVTPLINLDPALARHDGTPGHDGARFFSGRRHTSHCFPNNGCDFNRWGIRLDGDPVAEEDVPDSLGGDEETVEGIRGLEIGGRGEMLGGVSAVEAAEPDSALADERCVPTGIPPDAVLNSRHKTSLATVPGDDPSRTARSERSAATSAGTRTVTTTDPPGRPVRGIRIR